MRALSASSLERGSLRAGKQAFDRNSKLAQTYRVTRSLSPVTILMSMPLRFSAAIAAPALALGRIEEGGEAGEHEIPLVAYRDMALRGRLIAPGDAEHAKAFFAERLELRRGARHRGGVERVGVVLAGDFIATR